MSEIIEPTRSKRITLSEILELVLTKNSGDRSTVALTRTASGEVVIDVQVSAETIEQASAAAEVELARLSELYPHSSEREPTVSLSRNAKGDTQVEVKGNGWGDTQAVYDRARGAYPMASGQSARAGSVA